MSSAFNAKASPAALCAMVWSAVAALLALWSLAAWALHTLATWSVSMAGALTGATPGLGAMVVPAGWVDWLPPEAVRWATGLAAWLAPLADALLQAAPALAGGLTTVAWVAWGVGVVLLVLLGAGAHLFIAHGRGRTASALRSA